MKKTLLILCALVCGTLAFAQTGTSDEEDQYIYDLTDQLANPSFELDDVDNLTVDDGRCDETVGGAWKVTSLTGWDLVAPTHSNSGYPVSDIMSADATSTDNNFGVPGEPSDETYMLYLRNAHAEQNSNNHLDDASVMQTLILPAGEYKLTVDSKCIATDANAGTVTLVAGDESTTLTIHVTANGTDDTAKEPFLDAWDTAVLEFALDATTIVTLGVNIEFTDGSTNYPLSVLLDNFQLSSTEDVKALDFDYDVTWELANPSFEVDNVVANLTVDTGRSITDEDGNLETACAWSVTSLTGWTLPTLSGATYGVSDLMTKDATSTDNNFGVPGDPSDGTYMLYIRDAWLSSEEDVKLEQKLTLPAGDYKITVDTKCVSASTATATLFVGDESTALTIHSTSNGSAETASNPFLNAWDTAELIFSLDAEATVSVGIDFDFPQNASNGSFLIDNFKLYAGTAITEEITWTMTEAGWGTMILPFAPASIPDGLTLYAGDALTIEGSTITVGTPAESIEANTPYLVKGEVEQDTEYTFTGTPTNEGEIHTTGLLTGTLVDLAVGTGAAFATDGTMYLLQNHEDEDVAFYPIIAATETEDNSKDATLDAYHCYLTIAAEESDEGEPAKLSIVLPGAGMETGIVAVEGAEAEANGAIYDLSGRRVAKAVKGVYIQNGKKVLVK